MADIVEEKTGVDFLAIETAQQAAEKAEALGVPLRPGMAWGEIVEAGAKVGVAIG